MTKSKTNENLKFLIGLFFIVLVLLLSVFGIFYFSPTIRNLRYVYNDNPGKIEMLPLNVSYALSDYDGQIDQRSIYKALYILVNETIPKYYKNINKIKEQGISDYFNKNYVVIAKELGIINESDFESFINEIQKLNGDKLILSQYFFHPDAVAKKKGYLENVLIVKYENNQKIGLYINVSNKKNETIYPVTCTGGVYKEYLEYEYN